MVLDYSKWDAIELSDDSDIEVHPNVDKKSFIRAKQAQTHQEREHRRHRIDTLRYERVINDGLISRIDRLLTALKSHKAETRSADELVFQSLLESANDSSADTPPPPPSANVHKNVGEQPTYSKMMAALVDQVKKAVDEKKVENRYEAYLEEVEEHKSKVVGLQKQLEIELAKLEKEESRHITSDHIHDGFNYSNVPKNAAPPLSKSTEPELLNPGSVNRDPLLRSDTGQSSGADADIEEGANADEIDDDSVEASALAKEFAKIPASDYRASHNFILQHNQILNEKETDGLLIEAFNSEIDGKPKHARQCVHQALLIQYCRSLGRDGVGLFFKRVTTKDHQAQKMFSDDVRDTYARIHTRAAEIKKEREANPEEAGVEQIQLHAVDPNTQINIAVPPADSTDPEVQNSRKLFDGFPPGLQRALQTGQLDEVNKVLAKMSVDEAEEVVGQLGEGGMLSLEEGVIDATTDEGRKAVQEIEKNHKMPGMVDETDLAATPPA